MIFFFYDLSSFFQDIRKKINLIRFLLGEFFLLKTKNFFRINIRISDFFHNEPAFRKETNFKANSFREGLNYVL